MLNKQKALYAAVSGIVGLAATAAQAAIPGTDGTGAFLQYPYYTVNGGNDTYMSIVNSTSSVKVVKVRFLDGKNTKEVLDFNLFLSPFDVWTASIFKNAAGGATIKTADTSCTAPKFPDAGVDFRTTRFTERDLDGNIIDNSITRTAEGHMEVIEMGVVTDTAVATAATHVAGVPKDCAFLQTIYTGANGAFVAPAYQNSVSAPTGGLFGSGTLINNAAGTGYGYNAHAINGVYSLPVHFGPSSTFPNLAQADPNASFFQGSNVFTATYASGADAMSVLYQSSSVMGEWVTDATIGAGTDAVITFPTKTFYTPSCGFAANRPFTNNGFCPNGAPEVISLGAYDREERTSVQQLEFSPAPPGGSTSLPWEVNVVSIRNSDVLGSKLKASVTPPTGSSGWFKVGFDGVNRTITSNPGATRNGTACGTLVARGLPVQGFVFQRIVSTLPAGAGTILSNYGQNYDLRTERSVTCQ
jgi:hypothetical protein